MFLIKVKDFNKNLGKYAKNEQILDALITLSNDAKVK